MANATKSFDNIHVPIFECTDSAQDSTITKVRHNTQGIFKLDVFVLFQLSKGARLWLDDQWSVQNKSSIDVHDARLYGLIHEHLLDLLTIADTPTTIEVTLDRADVVLMRSFLEMRMKHCEIERDNRDDKFNADTYISMKLLLLEIREWLIGEVIGHVTPGKIYDDRDPSDDNHLEQS